MGFTAEAQSTQRLLILDSHLGVLSVSALKVVADPSFGGSAVNAKKRHDDVLRKAKAARPQLSLAPVHADAGVDGRRAMHYQPGRRPLLDRCPRSEVLGRRFVALVQCPRTSKERNR